MSKPSKNSRRSCEICGVREVHLSTRRLFSRFPLDEVRCKEWVRVTGNEDLVHVPIEKLHELKHVCGNHFELKYLNKSRSRLLKNAIPTLNFMANPLTENQMSEFPLHMFKSQESTLKPGPIQTAKNLLPEIQETSFSRSSIQTQEKSMKRPLFESQETLTPSPKKVCTPTSSGSAREVPGELTPRKKKLIEKLSKTQLCLKSLKKSALLLEKIESPVLREFVINACKNEKRKSKARRWTTQHKISCLAIFKRSPKTYRYLSSAMVLPSVKTLQNILKKIPMQPGINQCVLKYLKKISVDTDEKDKLCCLTFDEMAIKPRLIYNETADIVEGFEDLGELGRTVETANHALVFMLQGLRTTFKQPLAFYFTKGTISSAKLAMMIKSIITEVSSCGFTVVNTVCDQGPTNRGALKILREASGPYLDGSNHYFKVEGRPIYIVYDIPHLFKSIRNNFLNSGQIIIDGKKGLWDNLVEMELENRKELYFIKITERHVNPMHRAKMKVKLAAQLLSYSTASFLKLLARSEKEPKKNDLLNTAHVVLMLDRLFDLTNGSDGPSDEKRKLRPNVSETSDHLEQWAYYIKILNNTKFVDKNGIESKNVKCIEGYITSLKSFRDIWQLVQASGFQYLNLRNLNQDALENLFGIIRQHSPTDRNPTAAHFMSALKTSVVTRLTGPHSRGSNCKRDNKTLLTDFHDVVFGENESISDVDNIIPEESAEKIPFSLDSSCEKDISATQDFPILEFPEEDYVIEEDFSILSEQPTVYVAGYIASRILKKSNCETCKNDLTVQNPEDNPVYDVIVLKEWWKEKFSLTYPSVNFCKIIKILVDVDLLAHIHLPNVRELACTLYTVHLQNLSFMCPEHRNDIQNACFQLTSKLLIRRHCQIINSNIALKEEYVANKKKRAEQGGIS